jgi:RNA polymerase sigma factor (sigma-70 family)
MNETTLLMRWQRDHDAEAFAAIVSRYSGLVYGTCRRMLGNPHDAQDAAQECFARLAQADASSVSYIGGWLHRVAANLCRDHIKSAARRRDREEVFAETVPVVVQSSWDDLQQHIDEAIDALPEGSRYAIQAHFLEGRTHEDIARELDITRSGVTHRIERGIEAIRRMLKERGVIVASTTLGAFLAAQAAEAVPAPVAAALAKLALAGPGATAGVTPTGVGLAGWLTTKTAVTVVALVTISIGVWYIAGRTSSDVSATPTAQNSPLHVEPQELTARDALAKYQASVDNFATSVRRVTLNASATSNAVGFEVMRYFYTIEWRQDAKKLDIVLEYGNLDDYGAFSGKVRQRRIVLNDWFIEYHPPENVARIYPFFFLDGASRAPKVRARLQSAEALDGIFCHDFQSVFSIGQLPDTKVALGPPETVDGHDCMVVRLSGIHGDYRLWLDPQVGYLPRRVDVEKSAQHRFDRYEKVGEINPRDVGNAKDLSTVAWRFKMHSIDIEMIDGAFAITEARIEERRVFTGDIYVTTDKELKMEALDRTPNFKNFGAFVPDLPNGTTLAVGRDGRTYVWSNGAVEVHDGDEHSENE